MSRPIGRLEQHVLHPALDPGDVAAAIDQGDIDPADREAVVVIRLDHDVHVALMGLAGFRILDLGNPDVGAEERLEGGRGALGAGAPQQPGQDEAAGERTGLDLQDDAGANALRHAHSPASRRPSTASTRSFSVRSV